MIFADDWSQVAHGVKVLDTILEMLELKCMLSVAFWTGREHTNQGSSCGPMEGRARRLSLVHSRSWAHTTCRQLPFPRRRWTMSEWNHWRHTILQTAYSTDWCPTWWIEMVQRVIIYLSCLRTTEKLAFQVCSTAHTDAWLVLLDFPLACLFWHIISLFSALFKCVFCQHLGIKSL